MPRPVITGRTEQNRTEQNVPEDDRGGGEGEEKRRENRVRKEGVGKRERQRGGKILG